MIGLGSDKNTKYLQISGTRPNRRATHAFETLPTVDVVTESKFSEAFDTIEKGLTRNTKYSFIFYLRFAHQWTFCDSHWLLQYIHIFFNRLVNFRCFICVSCVILVILIASVTTVTFFILDFSYKVINLTFQPLFYLKCSMVSWS